ncbi:hypothetical protein BDP27DRAFT_1356060 [Rhodocollybia butyracea]|uniref:DUF6533 domain-containing protein n=1 Tax=Rhodocollybia butyracea TaxID=206335 RepID=A0A9P5P2G5_9AGAR|nr:hypothetical protein BDP27DRAFT_1356060 [Rhodocollybia butyracea]
MSLVVGPSEVLAQVQWSSYVELVSFVVILYDYLVTLDLEVKYFWNCHLKGLGTILFYTNRYLSLLGNIPIIVFMFWREPLLHLSNGCHALEMYQQFFLFLVQLVVGVLFILRVYAIYAGDKRILIFLCVLATGMIGNGLVDPMVSFPNDAKDLNVPQSLISQLGCLQSYTAAHERENVDMVYLWLGPLLLDIIVFSLTLWKTLQLHKDIPGGIGTVIMHDGELNFLCMRHSNAHYLFRHTILWDYMKGLLPVSTNIVASVLISRLMLNLRDHQHNQQAVRAMECIRGIGNLAYIDSNPSHGVAHNSIQGCPEQGHVIWPSSNQKMWKVGDCTGFGIGHQG